MSLHRIARHILPFVVSGLLFMPVAASATTEYFVDYARTGSGDGSSANPWKYRSDINWSTIATALQSDAVTIYFSSRTTWSNSQEIKIPAGTSAAATAARRLTLDGHSQYNTVASGAAAWQTETIPTNRATLTNDGATGGTIIVASNNAFMTIRGFVLLRPTWGGVILGEDNPTVNIHDILVEDNVIDTPLNNHGVWLGYGEVGCYNITVRGNTISNTPLEGIYMGHYSFLPNTITGTVIEFNTVINSGTSGEGDIDIKAGNFGAIVRYNKVYSGSTGRVLAGVVISASDVQVYGNELFGLQPRSLSDGGNGIQINADGDGLGHGKILDNLLVYNNLIYGNAQRGISMYATAAGAAITNVRMLNNTIVANGNIGVHTSGSVAHPITFAAFENNIISSNASYAMNVSSGTSFTSLDYNCFYGAGALFRYQDAEKTWSQWTALGFDAHGVNADPQLDGSYMPKAGSPVLSAGIVEGAFTTDKNRGLRGTSWDIGAYEYGATLSPPLQPQGLKIVR